MQKETEKLIKKYFGTEGFIAEDKILYFLNFLTETKSLPDIKIRPEVEEKVQKAWDDCMLESVKNEILLDYSL